MSTRTLAAEAPPSETTLDETPSSSGITLNEDQERATQALTEFLSEGEPGADFGIFGAAGTGKTTVIAEAFRRLPHLQVCFSAPTHKAAGVLASKAEPGQDVSTIHRLLGCRKIRNEEKGEIEFRPDPARPGPFGGYEVVVVDECSMVGEQMRGWIEQAKEHAFPDVPRVVYLGDPYQLAPVKDGDRSPTFGVEHVELQQIMRHEGIIQRACTDVRESMGKSALPRFAREGRDEHGVIERYPSGNAGLDRFFQRYTEAKGDKKILAFRNDEVDHMNQYMRERVLGSDASLPYVPGERLTMISTHEISGGGMLYTGTDIDVITAKPSYQHGLYCWELTVETDWGLLAVIHAFGDRAQSREYSTERARRKAAARAGEGWRPYFELEEAFAHVRPGYATTIHKSQGSTYDEVFFLQSDILHMRDLELRDRLLYVAYSRARRALHLI